MPRLVNEFRRELPPARSKLLVQEQVRHSSACPRCETRSPRGSVAEPLPESRLPQRTQADQGRERCIRMTCVRRKRCILPSEKRAAAWASIPTHATKHNQLHEPWNHEPLAVVASEQSVSFLVPRHFPLLRIEVQRPPDAIRDVRKVHERRGICTFLDLMVQVLALAAPDCIHEVLPVVPPLTLLRAGLLIAPEERLVRVVSVDRHVAL